MNILIIQRPGSTIGGDWHFASYYAAAMQQAGIEVTLAGADNIPDLMPFDLVHIMAACAPEWGIEAATEVKRAKKPLIITPLYWPRDTRLRFYGQSADLFPGYKQAITTILLLADVWACVTMSELIRCYALVPRHPAFVMGVGRPEIKIKANKTPDDYVLCAARVEQHKNQLSLARACKMMGLRLECVGPIQDKSYAYQVAALGGNVRGELSHEKTLEMMANCRVHALPSFGEIAAHANLEAAVMGVPSVMCLDAAEPEFFGSGGIYCDASNWRDIADAVWLAWHRPRGQWCTNYIPTWDEVAQRVITWIQSVS